MYIIQHHQNFTIYIVCVDIKLDDIDNFKQGK